ncbi:hypothetical protein TKK_0001128 [Trichogramma kaykai]
MQSNNNGNDEEEDAGDNQCDSQLAVARIKTRQPRAQRRAAAGPLLTTCQQNVVVVVALVSLHASVGQFG